MITTKFCDEEKRTALYLHGLEQEDRAWILKQLPVEQSLLLVHLIDELKELGLPRGNFSYGDISGATKASTEERLDTARHIRRLDNIEVQDLAALVKYIENASMAVLYDVFSKEPLEIISMVLRMRSWSWHVEFVEQFDASRRFQLREVLQRDRSRSSDDLAPKFQSAILNTIAIKISDCEQSSSNPTMNGVDDVAHRSVSAWLKSIVLPKTRWRKRM